jgi:ADP-ribosylglycohydrolase
VSGREHPPADDNQHLIEWLFEQKLINVKRSSLFDSQPQSSDSGIDFDRVEGMLLGLAIGDSLGNTTEGMLPGERRKRRGEVRGYLPNRYADDRPVGVPSDDTQLAFWTLEQLLDDGRLDPDRLAQRFARDQIFGIGKTVSEFLRNYKETGHRWYEAGPDSAGNGALMRIAPVLVPHVRNPSTLLWADTALCAMLTHNDRASISSCLSLVELLWDALQMDEPPLASWWGEIFCSTMEPLEGDAHYSPRSPDLEPYDGPVGRYASMMVTGALAEDLSVLDACRRWHSGAFLLETVPSVLYILTRHANDPEEAIVCAVNNTKDNDTVAAIVGAVVGALHGKSGLPKDWIDNLLGRTGAHDDGRIFELLEQTKERWW